VPQVPLFLQPLGAPPSEVEQLVHAIILYVVLRLAQFKFFKRLMGKDSKDFRIQIFSNRKNEFLLIYFVTVSVIL
jgi:hypothetical protein